MKVKVSDVFVSVIPSNAEESALNIEDRADSSVACTHEGGFQNDKIRN